MVLDILRNRCLKFPLFKTKKYKDFDNLIKEMLKRNKKKKNLP